MKKASIIIVTILVSFSASFAQEETAKVREAGLTFSNFSSFGLTYRFGNENAVWRLNALTGNSSNYTTDNSDNYYFYDSLTQESSYETVNKSSNVNISFGREYRKLLAEKLEFRYGMDLSLGYSSQKSERSSDDDTYIYSTINNRRTITPGINFVLGFNYLISDAIVLGAEVKPNMSYNIIKTESESGYDDNRTVREYSTNAFTYGLSNSVLLSLAYRF